MLAYQHMHDAGKIYPNDIQRCKNDTRASANVRAHTQYIQLQFQKKKNEEGKKETSSSLSRAPQGVSIVIFALINSPQK
jgi:hypothetical protein